MGVALQRKSGARFDPVGRTPPFTLPFVGPAAHLTRWLTAFPTTKTRMHKMCARLPRTLFSRRGTSRLRGEA
jgi:hypothetical protein